METRDVLEYNDKPAVRAIARDAARNNHRFSGLVMGIVKSTQFQMKKVSPSNSPAVVAAAGRRELLQVSASRRLNLSLGSASWHLSTYTDRASPFQVTSP